MAHHQSLDYIVRKRFSSRMLNSFLQKVNELNSPVQCEEAGPRSCRMSLWSQLPSFQMCYDTCAGEPCQLVTPHAVCWGVEGSASHAKMVCLIPIRAN